jgi:hypothetical protein
MRRARLSLRMIVVCSLLCGQLASCKRSTDVVPNATLIQRTNAALSSRKLPALPAGITDVRCWTGGMFAKYMNVRFSASPEQAVAGCYLEFRIEGKECRVVANHPLVGTPEDIRRVSLSLLAKGTGMLSQPWFRSVYETRHGWYYDYFSQDGPTGYDIFYDLDNQQLYLYWSYS